MDFSETVRAGLRRDIQDCVFGIKRHVFTFPPAAVPPFTLPIVLYKASRFCGDSCGVFLQRAKCQFKDTDRREFAFTEAGW